MAEQTDCWLVANNVQQRLLILNHAVHILTTAEGPSVGLRKHDRLLLNEVVNGRFVGAMKQGEE